MIYIKTNEGKESNEFRIDLDPALALIYPGKFKVKFSHFPIENPEGEFGSNLGWETDIIPGGWATWRSGACPRCDISLYTQDGDHLFTRRWNSILDGGKIEKAFSLFIKANPGCKGIVIGPHDGEWGHWVDPVRNMGVECLLIEGSEKQFNKLKKNYSELPNCTFLNHIVTVKGEDVTWYTTDGGYTDSVVLEVSEKYVSGKEISSETKPSRAVNELIEEQGYTDLDFLHLDLEGYDTDLIMGLKYLPRMIVFENNHCKDMGKYDEARNYLERKGYSIVEEGIDTLAIKA